MQEYWRNSWFQNVGEIDRWATELFLVGRKNFLILLNNIVITHLNILKFIKSEPFLLITLSYKRLNMNYKYRKFAH